MMMSATAELAYGLLWKDRPHEARVLLREAIGKEGQRRGIQYAIDTVPDRNKEAISITAIHLVHLGKTIEVRAEIEGRWVTVITELADGAFSHIVEGGGMETAYLDALRAALFAHTA